MPIMAANDQNDARGSAVVLANTAKRCVDAVQAPAKHVAALNNLFRLLEAYRSHRFLGFEYEPHAARGTESLTLLPPMERHVLDLRDALDKAIGDVYSDEDKNSALDSIENVLRSVAYPEKSLTSKESDRTRVSTFLETFIHNLYVVR